MAPILRVCFKEIFDEINQVIDLGKIEVDGQDIPLEFYLSGDYKVHSRHKSKSLLCMFRVGCLLIKVPPTFYRYIKNACQKLKFVCHTYCKIQTVGI